MDSGRVQRFEEEKKALRPLPPYRFEISEWRSAKVHPDCHIQVEKNFYSVPFVNVGQRVRVRMTEKMIEVFNEDSQPIAAHGKLMGIGRISTFDSHYPEAKLSVARFEVRHAQEQARRLGPHVEKLVDELLSVAMSGKEQGTVFDIGQSGLLEGQRGVSLAVLKTGPGDLAPGQVLSHYP